MLSVAEKITITVIIYIKQNTSIIFTALDTLLHEKNLV